MIENAKCNTANAYDRTLQYARDKLSKYPFTQCCRVAFQSVLIAACVPVLFITSGAVPAESFSNWLYDASSTQNSLEIAQVTVDHILSSELFVEYVN